MKIARTLMFTARVAIQAADGFFVLSAALVAFGVCRGIAPYSAESGLLVGLLLMLVFRDWQNARRMARLDRMIDERGELLDEQSKMLGACQTMIDWYQKRERLEPPS